MENVICTHCGSENVNYERTGPHIKATCNTCGRYIKFVKYMPDKGTAIKIIELLKGGEGGDITGD